MCRVSLLETTFLDPPVPPEPRYYCLLFVLYLNEPKKLIYNIGTKILFWSALAITRRGLHLFQKLLMIPEALDELSQIRMSKRV